MTMNSIYFVTDHTNIQGLGEWFIEFIRDLGRFETSEVQISSEPEKASIILFLESGISRGRWPVRNHLKSHPLYRKYKEKCFIWCTEDLPWSYLPGLYASMPQQFFDPAIHRGFTYFTLPTADITVPDQQRDIFYNFIGGPTSPVRRAIWTVSHPTNAVVRQTVNYNHGNQPDRDNKEEYARILARSWFTLCPRGVGTSSYRIFEAMRFGSVPVILSDEWVPPDGPDWSACSIRIPEANYASIPTQLTPYLESAERMGQVARRSYTEFFSHEQLLQNIVRLTSLITTRSSWLSNSLFYRQQASGMLNRFTNRIRRTLRWTR